MRPCGSLQSNEEMDAILKACSDAGVQFMDGRHVTPLAVTPLSLVCINSQVPVLHIHSAVGWRLTQGPVLITCLLTHGHHLITHRPLKRRQNTRVCWAGRRYTGYVRLCTFCSTGTMWMHNPRALHMRSVLDDPRAVGRLRSVTSSFAFPGDCSAFLQGPAFHSLNLTRTADQTGNPLLAARI